MLAFSMNSFAIVVHVSTFDKWIADSQKNEKKLKSCRKELGLAEVAFKKGLFDFGKAGGAMGKVGGAMGLAGLGLAVAGSGPTTGETFEDAQNRQETKNKLLVGGVVLYSLGSLIAGFGVNYFGKTSHDFIDVIDETFYLLNGPSSVEKKNKKLKKLTQLKSLTKKINKNLPSINTNNDSNERVM